MLALVLVLMIGAGVWQPAGAQQAITVVLEPTLGYGVKGVATLSPEGNGTAVYLDITGLAPFASAQASLHAGTCARPGASFAELPRLSADGSGRAVVRGRIRFRGADDVPFATAADGQHVVAVALPGRIAACGAVPSLAASLIESALLSAGERQQAIQFNPAAALQKRIFADGFVPNSPEFSLGVQGTVYAGQRAEHLRTGAVRVYYAPTGEWNRVSFYQRGSAAETVGAVLMPQAERLQAIQFNTGAALQKRIFGDGFVPNSPEYAAQIAGVAYTAQRAENLETGTVRIYYAVTGDWGNVRVAERPAQ